MAKHVVTSMSQQQTQRNNRAIELLAAETNKTHGAGTVVRASDMIAKPPRLSTGSLWFDLALGGGWPVNAWSEIVGQESSGKTATALLPIAIAMQKDPKFTALWCAAEPFDLPYAQAIGVDPSRLWLLEENTMEIVYDEVVHYVEERSVDMAVIDAYPSLVTDAEDTAFIGDAQVSPGARLTGKFMRLMTKAAKRSLIDPDDRPFTGLFINQWRNKIGVCFQYKTKVLLADGTWDWIGRIVNQKLQVEVLSYDEASGKVVPQRVVGWHDNGDAVDGFLDIGVRSVASLNGRPTQMTVTRQHHIMTPTGWREAGDLVPGDQVYQPTEEKLSPLHWEFIRGGLLGDSSLKQSGARTASLRIGHGYKQTDYLRWKQSIINLPTAADYVRDVDGSLHVDWKPLSELEDTRRHIYETEVGKRHFGQEFIDRLSVLSLAIWYLDDGSLAVRSLGDERKAGRATISAKSMTSESRERLLTWLHQLVHEDISINGHGVFVFTKNATDVLLTLVSPYVPSCMSYKLLNAHTPGGDHFSIDSIHDQWGLTLTEVVSVKEAPRRKSNKRFDITVENTHTYFAGGALVHNSFGDPRTTPGGVGKNFWFASRVEISRSDWIKDADKYMIGQSIKMNVFKNKSATPRKEGMCNFYFDDAEGHRMGEFDTAFEVFTLAQSFNVIERPGKFFLHHGEKMASTNAELQARIRSEEDFCALLEAEIRHKVLGTPLPVLTAPTPIRTSEPEPAPATRRSRPGSKAA